MFPLLEAKAIELIPGIASAVRRDIAVNMPRISFPALESDLAVIGGIVRRNGKVIDFPARPLIGNLLDNLI